MDSNHYHQFVILRRSHYAIGVFSVHKRTWTFNLPRIRRMLSPIELYEHFSYPVRPRTWNHLSQSQVCCQLHYRVLLERVVRIELTSKAWKAIIINHYTILAFVAGVGVEPTISRLMRPEWLFRFTLPLYCGATQIRTEDLTLQMLCVRQLYHSPWSDLSPIVTLHSLAPF